MIATLIPYLPYPIKTNKPKMDAVKNPPLHPVIPPITTPNPFPNNNPNCIKLNFFPLSSALYKSPIIAKPISKNAPFPIAAIRKKHRKKL